MQLYVLLAAYLLGKLIPPQQMLEAMEVFFSIYSITTIFMEMENFVVQFSRYFWCPSFGRPFVVVAQACFSVRKHLKTITQTLSDP